MFDLFVREIRASMLGRGCGLLGILLFSLGSIFSSIYQTLNRCIFLSTFGVLFGSNLWSFHNFIHFSYFSIIDMLMFTSNKTVNY